MRVTERGELHIRPTGKSAWREFEHLYVTDFHTLVLSDSLHMMITRLGEMEYVNGRRSRSQAAQTARWWREGIERGIMERSAEAWERGEQPTHAGLDEDLMVTLWVERGYE